MIDRARGTPHPRYPNSIYPLDYGYLDQTTSEDGQGVDVWVGTQHDAKVVGLICTVDNLKREMEVKLLIGCSATEITTVQAFLSELKMSYTLLLRTSLAVS